MAETMLQTVFMAKTPYPADNEKFAHRLNQVLDERGYPPKFAGRQTELAREFGVTPKAASKWLGGEVLPRMGVIQQMVRRWNVSFEWLMSGKGEPFPGRADELRVMIDQLNPVQQEAIRMLITSMVHGTQGTKN